MHWESGLWAESGDPQMFWPDHWAVWNSKIWTQVLFHFDTSAVFFTREFFYIATSFHLLLQINATFLGVLSSKRWMDRSGIRKYWITLLALRESTKRNSKFLPSLLLQVKPSWNICFVFLSPRPLGRLMLLNTHPLILPRYRLIFWIPLSQRHNLLSPLSWTQHDVQHDQRLSPPRLPLTETLWAPCLSVSADCTCKILVKSPSGRSYSQI